MALDGKIVEEIRKLIIDTFGENGRGISNLDEYTNVWDLGYVISKESPYPLDIGSIAPFQTRAGGLYGDKVQEDWIRDDPPHEAKKFMTWKVGTTGTEPGHQFPERHEPFRGTRPASTKPYNVLKSLEFAYRDKVHSKQAHICLFYCGHDS
jgi:hypothetical protein